MFIFAHVFAGALCGLLLWHLTHDRRAIPAGIGGALLPDLVDKSLGLLFPAVLGSGRTVFHSLGSIGFLVLILLVAVPAHYRLPGTGFTAAVLLHQLSDEMWALPANWLYPLLGPFQGTMIPDYIGTYFWFEITNPGEWLFLSGTVMILVMSDPGILRSRLPFLPERLVTGISPVLNVVLGAAGLFLVAAGFMIPGGTFITPLYSPVTTVLAGLFLLIGAVVMSRVHFAS